MSQLLASSSQSVGASASVLPLKFSIDWFDLPAVQGTFKSVLQHHNSKASILHDNRKGDACSNHRGS